MHDVKCFDNYVIYGMGGPFDAPTQNTLNAYIQIVTVTKWPVGAVGFSFFGCAIPFYMQHDVTLVY